MLILLNLWYLFIAYKNKHLLQCIQKKKNDEAISIIERHSLSYGLFGYKRRTLLHYTAEYSNVNIANYLIDRGFNLEAVADANGETPLTIALKVGNNDMISLLIAVQKSSLNIHEFIQTASLTFPKDSQIIKRLLDNLTRKCSDNKEIAVKLLKFNCPLSIAVRVFKNAELTKLMLDHDCPIDLASTGETALHAAVEILDLDNVKLLLERGAEIGALDDKNSTPLSRFKISSNDSDEKLEILRLLLGNNASLEVPCFRRRRFYHIFRPTSTVLRKLLAAKDHRTLKVLIEYIELFQYDLSGRKPFEYLLTNKTALAISKANVPDKSVWKHRDVTEPAGYSKKGFFLLINTKDRSPYPKCLDNFLFLKYLTYETSEYGEALFIVEFLKILKKDVTISKSKYDECIFYDPTIKNLSNFAKTQLAHLAMLESFGVSLSESIVENINKVNDTYRKIFDSCKKQIEKMREVTVCESITLHKIMRDSQKTLNMYARNPQFQLNYESSVKYEIDYICPNYANVLKYRINHAIVSAEMEHKAAIFVFKVTGLPSVIVYKVIDYFNYFDLRDLYNNIVNNEL